MHVGKAAEMAMLTGKPAGAKAGAQSGGTAKVVKVGPTT